MQFQTIPFTLLPHQKRFMEMDIIWTPPIPAGLDTILLPLPVAAPEVMQPAALAAVNRPG
jgi:hypothetical protein